MPVEMGASSSALPADIGALINRQSKLHIVEWQHMDLYKFYPMALAASWTVRGLLYPLNVIKARLQLQKQNHAYRGTIHAFRNICTHEGYSALYRGFWVTLPQIGGSFVYSTIYEKMRSVLHLRAKIESTVVVSALVASHPLSHKLCLCQLPTDVISQHMTLGYAKMSEGQGGLASKKPDPADRMDVDEEELDPEILQMSTEQIRERTMLLDNEIRIMRSEVQRINHNVQTLKEKVKENNERIKVNKQLPYLVSNVIELLDLEEQAEEEGANFDLDAHKTKCAVIKTSTRATYFLPVIGLVDHNELKPGDLVGVNKDSYLILEKLPPEYDSRVKAMEVDERPTETYTDIGGCDAQIKELIEAIVLPMLKKELFTNIGILPPKGVLMYGPPGTGKTMLARAVAAQTKSTFLKLAGPQLVQMFIGDGAKLVRDAFALAKEKAPAIIFIDELDAIGTKRFNSEKAGDREVQRTMLELLNQLDGFQPNDDVKVIAATNRVDVLDPALLRSGRLDRKIELPAPNEKARARILQIHSRKMNVDKDVNFDELARCTDDFNGAQCKAVCVESGMIALRRDSTIVKHEDFMDAILEVQAKKKATLNYYA